MNEINFVQALTDNLDILLHLQLQQYFSCKYFGNICKSLYNIKRGWNLFYHVITEMLEWFMYIHKHKP